MRSPEPYKVKLAFTDRDLGIIVYREYEYRQKVLRKKILPSKVREWTLKVNKMVALFNYLIEPLGIKADPLQYEPGKTVLDDLTNLIRYTKTEIGFREKYYPQWIRQGTISEDNAYVQLQGMKAVYNYLLELSKKIHGEQTGLF